MQSPDSQPDQSHSFESALSSLEALVKNMEAGNLSLADMVAKFEEGSKLIAMCESRLKDAELKIQQLRNAQEGPVLDAFDPDPSDGDLLA